MDVRAPGDDTMVGDTAGESSDGPGNQEMSAAAVAIFFRDKWNGPEGAVFDRGAPHVHGEQDHQLTLGLNPTAIPAGMHLLSSFCS